MVLLIVLGAGAVSPLAAETTVLRVGNWVPGFHLITKAILEPWTQAIEKESGNTLKFDIMTSALGRPNTYWDLVVDGTIDVGWGSRAIIPAVSP